MKNKNNIFKKSEEVYRTEPKAANRSIERHWSKPNYSEYVVSWKINARTR